MTVPKVLYHGTTMLRWAMIKRDGLLRCDMPKTWKAQEFLGIDTGYVYLASDIDEANMYGLNKSLLDIQYSDFSKNMKLNPNYKDSVILGINTDKLENIAIDPLGETEVIKQLHSMKNDDIHWYRYKGDIKLEHLFFYGYVPFDTYTDKIKNELMIINERKAQQARYLENRCYRPQSVMKQLSSFLR